jgi:hypothetical protein
MLHTNTSTIYSNVVCIFTVTSERAFFISTILINWAYSRNLGAFIDISWNKRKFCLYCQRY